MILVDTSVWIDHLRNNNTQLASLLHREAVCSHPFILGELYCGHMNQKEIFTNELQKLHFLTTASQHEVMTMIDKNNLAGKGVGWIDMHLLASCLIEHASLWSLDKSLQKLSRELGISFEAS